MERLGAQQRQRLGRDAQHVLPPEGLDRHMLGRQAAIGRIVGTKFQQFLEVKRGRGHGWHLRPVIGLIRSCGEAPIL
jgi:hypothetical protein